MFSKPISGLKKFPIPLSILFFPPPKHPSSMCNVIPSSEVLLKVVLFFKHPSPVGQPPEGAVVSVGTLAEAVDETCFIKHL